MNEYGFMLREYMNWGREFQTAATPGHHTFNANTFDK